MEIRLTERQIVALNFLLIAVLAYFAARSVNDLVALRVTPASAPVPHAAARVIDDGATANRSRGAYQEIVNRDIFNLAPPPQHVVVIEKIDLHLQLIGVSTSSAGKPPYAILADATGQQNVYRLGETVPNAGKLIEVDRDRVIIDHNGKHIVIRLPKDEMPGPVEAAQPIQPPGGDDNADASNDNPDDSFDPNVEDLGDNRYKIPRETLDHSVTNLSQLLTQIRAIPNIQNGKTNGFALSEIEPGSVFDEMGLQEGDVLRSVNGQQIRDPGQAMQMMGGLRNASQISLQVMRDGELTTLSYQIQ